MTEHTTPNNWPELKPCPFCAETEEDGSLVMNVFDDGNNGYLTTVWCMDCGGKGPTASDDETAAERWQETTMFDMHEIKCKECGAIIGYSDADYVPLITCAACKNKENNQ